MPDFQAPQNLQTQLRMDEALDVSFDRVDKYDAPLLLIGLGGTGADVVSTIKFTLANRFKLPKTADGKLIPVPRRTGYLVIDSDATGKDAFDNNEFVNISSGVDLSALLADLDHRQLSASQKEWVHHDLHDVGNQGGGIGAGTYRAASRLMLDCKYQEVYSRIRDALTSLVTMQAGQVGTNGAARIFVITGIGGGTGSGTFLDVAQIIRHLMKTDSSLQGKIYALSAYIVMPDLTIAHLQEQGAADSMIDIVKHNSYAALKELDFWMSYNKHQTPYTMTYSTGAKIRWTQPFDHVTLLSGTNVEGQLFQDGYKLVQRTVAENLLHYMANEKTEVDGNGAATWSYQSYESNLDAQSQVCEPRMTLPLTHVYRAVGAYSKRIPKKKILYYEGRLLFKTFLPPRNDQGFFVPNDKLLRDGQADQRFVRILDVKFDKLYNQFGHVAPYPAICRDFNGRDKTTVDGLRNCNPPHENYRGWQKKVAPAAHEFAETYLEQTWQRFMDWCREVMSNPAYGPFSLKQYLEDATVSMSTAFKNYATQAESRCNNLYSQINPATASCRNLYRHFMEPPITAGNKSVQAYLDALRQLLNFVRQYELYKEYARIMDILKKRVDEYLRTALVPLCELLDTLNEDFSAPQQNHDTLGSDLFQVAQMHGDIQRTFDDGNRDSAVSSAFLGRLCESTFETVPNVNVGSCGLTFTFSRDAKLKALKIMKEELDACFLNINGQSLDSIMALQCQDPDPTVQAENEKQFITNLTTSVVSSAVPLFSLSNTNNRTEITTNAAKELYLSVPQDATAFLAQLSPGAGGNRVTINSVSITPKASSLTDHIFCNITWDVLPLYSYSIISDLKAAYDRTLAEAGNTSPAMAIHLVNTGSPDADYVHNWRLLPDPVPFYLFSPDAACIADDHEYTRVRGLVDRLLTCGMLTIDSAEETPLPRPAYTFHIFRNPDGHALHNDDVLRQLDVLRVKTDSITGAPLTHDQLQKELSTLLGKAKICSKSATKSPSVMKVKLHLDPVTSPIDPFQGTNNPDQQREACRNYHKLVIEYAVHILLQHPALLRDVQYQIDSFEQIHQELEKIRLQANAWEPRIAYAETFARLFTYDLIRFDMMGNPVYTDETQAVCPLIQPALFRDDLKACRTVIKSVGAMADLDPKHPIRQTLEHRLRNLEKDWNDRAIQSALTQQEVQAQIQRLEKLAARSAEEHNHYRSQKMNDVHADHALLDKYIALISGVERYTGDRLETLRQIPFEEIQPVPPIPPVQPVPPASAAPWNCTCGKKGLTGKFCPECGKIRNPEPVVTWDCVCGQKGLTGKFCPECGRSPQAKPDTWNCTCGKTGLTGRFCPECGSSRP